MVDEHFTGRIERLGWGGLGIARHEDGRIILLRHSLALFPGELVKATISWKARHAEGQVTEVLEPAPGRIDPECPWAASCGGCSLQGAAGQGSSLKQQMVDDLIKKQLGPDTEWAWHPADRFTLRNVIQLHYQDGRLGYHERGSNNIVEVGSCMAARPELSGTVEQLREALADGDMPDLEGRWELCCGNPPVPVFAWQESDPGTVWQFSGGAWSESDGMVSYLLHDGEIRNHASAFFQTSGGAAIRFFRALFDRWEIGGARLHDLYGGCGLFSRLLADRFQSFSVVDNSEAGIASAVGNLRGMDARCFQRDVGRHLQKMRSRPDDVIIVDPPRSGLPKEVCHALNQQSAATLVLIGCDGAAFCRDLGRLREMWRLEVIEAADLFPWTDHCEFSARLCNRSI